MYAKKGEACNSELEIILIWKLFEALEVNDEVTQVKNENLRDSVSSDGLSSAGCVIRPFLNLRQKSEGVVVGRQ